MSKKKQRKAEQPKAEQPKALKPRDGGSIIPLGMDLGSMFSRTFTFTFNGEPLSGAAESSTSKPRTLKDRVADDLRSLGIDPTKAGGAELPRPAPDLTAYADALTEAIKTCPHRDVEDTIHSRGEYQCMDCGKYLSREDMRQRRAGLGGLFGGWFQ